MNSQKDAFVTGLTVGLDHPTSKSLRFVLCNAGGHNGFVKNAKLLFLKKSTIDYHDEVDGELFEKWILEQLLTNLVKTSVIVMDNTPYHYRRVAKLPTIARTVSNIKEWLSSKA